VRGPQVQQPGGVDLGRHLGELAVGELVAVQRNVALDALAAPLPGQVQGAAGHTGGDRGHGGAGHVHLLDVDDAATLAADDALGGHADAAEGHLGAQAGAVAHLVRHRAQLDPGESRGTRKQVSALAPGLPAMLAKTVASSSRATATPSSP
jgi:hypothetical protein